MKIIASIIIEVISQAALSKPKIVHLRNELTGKPEYIKKYTYDQESSARIDFPQWPILESYFAEGISKVRAETAKLVNSHIVDARANLHTAIHIQPIVYTKKNQYQKVSHINKKIGFAINENVEYDVNELEQFFFELKIPAKANIMETELLIHKTFDSLVPYIKSELYKKGALR